MGRVFLSAPTLFSQMWALPGPDHLLTLTCEGRTSSCPLFCYENVRAAPIQASLACPFTELLPNFFYRPVTFKF